MLVKVSLNLTPMQSACEVTPASSLSGFPIATLRTPLSAFSLPTFPVPTSDIRHPLLPGFFATKSTKDTKGELVLGKVASHFRACHAIASARRRVFRSSSSSPLRDLRALRGEPFSSSPARCFFNRRNLRNLWIHSSVTGLRFSRRNSPVCVTLCNIVYHPPEQEAVIGTAKQRFSSASSIMKRMSVITQKEQLS